MKQNLTFEDVCHVVMDHARARKWDQSNTSRSLAISLVLEASELLEHYQWSDETLATKSEITRELADVFIYAIQFAAREKIDIANAIAEKIAEQAEKYPVEIFAATDERERTKAWLTAKRNYNKNR